ncbi:MAG: Uncharacterized protein AWT59_2613 [Candidatus Gallionella acididurans]|uniref:Pyrroline-5-carboxylate reductase catalytic N-terminal domain-containing protein n=1 Tax=Candidatus Gallionella acididurans TaxID=1796491 RepID=A0A139BQI4_9PROT|nr:MAG: Uncharacterized protein AWT59_2613 [Candidatus Gallionella acididurans]
MKISILGTGKMGSAVGRQLAKCGYQVIFGSRDPTANMDKFSGINTISIKNYSEAALSANVVVVAVPWSFALELLKSLEDQLKGKVIVDLTNPLSADISRLVVGGNDSAAEQIASRLPESHVVKAFNAITADSFPTPNLCGEPAQIFYCSDNEAAKDVARTLITSVGYEHKNCGVLSNARYLEAIAMLWLQLAFWEEKGSEWSFKIVGEFEEVCA